MKSVRPIILLLFLPSALFGWSATDHERMTRLALREVASPWGLDKPCEVRPLSSFLKKIGKPENFSGYLKVNPGVNLEAGVRSGTKQTPLEVLSLYSNDPDDGRDQDLPKISPDQKWFGVKEGVNSQAFRHIEKPAFRLRHPANTFGFPLRAVGEATDRARIYFDLSRRAFSVGEEYWGWRFLAGSLHYLEDLHQPYHAGQITPSLLIRGLKEYLSWGYREKGFLGTFSHLVANSHNFYEVTVTAIREKDDWLRGDDVLSRPRSIKALAVEVRDASNRFFSDLVSAVTDATTPQLLGPHLFDPETGRVSDFLKKGPAFDRASKEIFEITRERFHSAGRAIRTAVHLAVSR